MPMYKIESNAELTALPILKFDNEAQMKAITEANLKPLLNAYFVADEYQLGNRRIDTLAFDDNTQSFVIIEYKNCQNDKAVDQSIAYWNLLQNNHQEILKLFNAWLNKNGADSITAGQINWAACKIAVIAPKFNHEQIEAFSYDDRIDLYIMYPLDNQKMLYFRKLPNRKPIRQANLEHALTPSELVLPRSITENTKSKIEPEPDTTQVDINNSSEKLVKDFLDYFTLADDKYTIKYINSSNQTIDGKRGMIYSIDWNGVVQGIITQLTNDVIMHIYGGTSNQPIDLPGFHKKHRINKDDDVDYYVYKGHITNHTDIINTLHAMKKITNYLKKQRKELQ